jgi:cytochrome b6
MKEAAPASLLVFGGSARGGRGFSSKPDPAGPASTGGKGGLHGPRKYALGAKPVRPWVDGVSGWWHDRFDLSPLVTFAAGKTVPIHRHSWIYLLGGAALFLFLLQVGSGCLLMLYYQPGVETSFHSVREIMTAVPYGWLVRSMHVWGAHLFIASVLLHLVTVLLTKAYRRPRELTWFSGVLLLFLALGLGFSGYLLPWNELSYYATLVGTQIAGSVPFVGDLIVQVLRGGAQVSGHTITRFYAAHVVILPLTLAVVLAFHLGAVQIQGMSLPLGLGPKRVKDRQPFFGEFLPTDASVWLLLLGVVATLAVVLPASIGMQADPLQPAPEGIKPEWYFLFMFQLLKYVPEALGVTLMAAGVAFLVLVPLLDRNAAREIPSPGFTILCLLLMAVAAVLQLKAMISPSAEHGAEALEAETYHPLRNTVWLVFLWLVIGLLIYYLQQLRRHNRQIRQLSTGESE